MIRCLILIFALASLPIGAAAQTVGPVGSGLTPGAPGAGTVLYGQALDANGLLPVYCNKSLPVTLTASVTAVAIPGVAGTIIHVCGLAVFAINVAGQPVSFAYGSGTCTGLGATLWATNSAIAVGYGNIFTPSALGQTLCYFNGTSTGQADLVYSQGPG